MPVRESQTNGFVPILRAMGPKRLNHLVSRLNRFELTRGEKQVIELTKGSFRDKGGLTKEEEVILEGIYKQKLRWAKLGLIAEKNRARDLTVNRPGRFRDKVHSESKN